MQKYPEFDGTQNCAGMDTEIFYQDAEDLQEYLDWQRKKLYANLRKICSDCPFLAECYVWGLHHEAYGIWGGTTAKQRMDERKKLGIKLVDPLLANYRGKK